MKIVIISAGVLPIPAVKGGAVENLLNNFIIENETNDKNNLIVFSIQDSAAQDEASKYEFTEFKFINNKSFLYRLLRLIRYGIKKITKLNISNQYISRVIKELKDLEYDLIIIENKPDFVLPLKKITDKKVILHLHNDYLAEETKKNKYILQQVDKVIVVSDYIRNQLKWYEKANKISTIYNGIDTLSFEKNKNLQEIRSLKNQMRLSDNDFVIMYSGRITKNKGIDKLIESVSKIEDPNVKLLVVGSSWYSNLEETPFIKGLKEKADLLKGRIIFTGFIDYCEMPKIYKLANILVVPSISTEAAGLVAIEARASGLPLIVSNSGGLPEYVNDTCAVIVDVNNKFCDNIENELRRLIYDKDLLQRMSESSTTGIDFYDKHHYYLRFMKTICKTFEEN